MGYTETDVTKWLMDNPDLSIEGELNYSRNSNSSVPQPKPKAHLPKLNEHQLQAAIHLTLPPPVSANRYWRTGKDRTGKSRTYVSDEAKAYKKEIGKIAKASGAKMLTGDVHIKLDVYRPAKRGDLDNSQKVILDGLQGILYVDDKQIIEIHARRFDDRANPRVEITITGANK